MRCAKNLLILALMLCVLARGQAATNTLVWQKAADRVSADIHNEALWPLLEDIAHQTGWHILVEPGADQLADVKFNNLPTGDALKKLLGGLNFALVPQTNGPDFLYVFMTTMRAATRPVAAAVVKHRHVANQLLVKLKPGADIDALAKAIGAKVIGRDDKLHMYLLEFADAAATDAALAQLQSNPDVESVSYNDILDPPVTPQAVASAPVGEPKLTLDPSTPGNPCNPVIGLIDTQVQPLGNGLDQFLESPISVVGNVAPVTGNITHGTAMAQTILAALAAQATSAQAIDGLTAVGPASAHSSVRILPVNVYESGDTTTSWDVALGVQAAVDNGATVLNMSLGSSDNSAVLADVIQQALAQGVVVFAAAGNTPVATATYPAAMPGVNAVTALSGPDQLASYANFGSFVEMALPGSSYVFLGNQAYIVQGTSPATAYATGIAAGTKTVNCGSWSDIESAMAQRYPVPAASQ
jgi:thermitase